MDKRRSWEYWWERTALPDFPRSSKWVRGQPIKIPTIYSPVRKKIVEEAKKSGSSNVLDVGCATCIDYDFFRDSGIKYTGVDITKKFLDFARKLYPEIDVRLHNVISLPFQDREFDTVYCKSLIEHLHPNEWKQAIIEAWRVTNKKLMLAFVLKPWDKPAEYNYMKEGYYDNFLNKKELSDLLLHLKDIKGSLLITSIGRHDLYMVEKNE